MALVKCKECGTEISSKAENCPKCGTITKNWWGRRRIISKAFIIMLPIIFLYKGGDFAAGVLVLAGFVFWVYSLCEHKSILDDFLTAFKFVIIIIIIIVSYFLVYEYPTLKEKTTTSSTPTVTPAPKEFLSITFREFNELFGAGATLTDAQKEVRFKEFKGKYVEWTCKVAEVTRSWFTEDEIYHISLRCDRFTTTSDLSVFLRKDQKDKALALVKGADVTFIARLYDYSAFLGHSADDGEIIRMRAR